MLRPDTAHPAWRRGPVPPLVLLALLPPLLLAAVNTGSVHLSPGEVWDALFAGTGTHSTIVLQLRLPRFLLALILGAGLSLGGFLVQALVRNPLADPYLMGLSAGAGFGANLRLLGLASVTAVSAWTLPLYAFAGGLMSLGLLLLLGLRSLRESPSRLLLAGIAVSSLFAALSGILIYAGTEGDALRNMVTWSFGSFAYAGWEEVTVSAVLLAVLWAGSLVLARVLDVLALGETQAAGLGLEVGRYRVILLVLVSLGVGGMVSFTGPVGFVGMMVPHITRGWMGFSHRPNLIFGGLLGGIFLALCDMLAQWLYPPVGLPIGIVTALLGVPFFLWLLLGSRYRFGD